MIRCCPLARPVGPTDWLIQYALRALFFTAGFFNNSPLKKAMFEVKWQLLCKTFFSRVVKGLKMNEKTSASFLQLTFEKSKKQKCQM